LAKNIINNMKKGY